MYAVRDAIGEEAVNRALSGIHRAVGLSGGRPIRPRVTCLNALLAETPDDLQSWISGHVRADHACTRTSATEAIARKTDDGRYEVTLTFEARKMHAGEQGEETDVALDDPVDIGVFDGDGNPLYLEKHRLDGSVSEVTVVVDEEPVTAGIDPYHKLIDRHPDDNEIRVKIDAG